MYLQWFPFESLRGDKTLRENLNNCLRASNFPKFARSEDSVVEVKVTLNTMLNGHFLKVQVSKRNNGDGAEDLRRIKRSNTKSKQGSMLLLRNVAFEGTGC